jgi:hypothetical protein
MRNPGTFGLVPMPARVKMLFLIVGCGTLGSAVLPSLLMLVLPDRPPWRSTTIVSQMALIGSVGLLLFAWGYVFWLASSVHVELIKGGILLHASPFRRPGKFFPWSVMRLDEARVYRFPEGRTLLPFHSTSSLGANRLRNGEKALLYVVDEESPFVYLPMTEGPSLVIQLETPEEFLEMVARFAVGVKA